MQLHDSHQRVIHDLRISITDRCNYKCVYCRTGNEGALYAELPFADYLRMARVFASLGITKIRLTGGEPLLRGGIVNFVRELSQLRTPEGNQLDIAVTTNGHLLSEMAQPLKDAGLHRVTVSMDAVDPDRFARITRVPNGYDNVLAGIRAARRVGLEPVNLDLEPVRGGRAGKQEADGVTVENEPRVRAQPGHIETLGADETGLLADGEDDIDRSAGNVVFMERAKYFANDGDSTLVVASEHGAPVAPQDRAV